MYYDVIFLFLVLSIISISKYVSLQACKLVRSINLFIYSETGSRRWLKNFWGNTIFRLVSHSSLRALSLVFRLLLYFLMIGYSKVSSCCCLNKGSSKVNMNWIGSLSLKFVFYRRLSSIKTCLPSKIVFHWRWSSIECRLSLNVIKGCLLSKVVFKRSSSSIKGCLLVCLSVLQKWQKISPPSAWVAAMSVMQHETSLNHIEYFL